MARLRDTVRLESADGGGAIENFTSLSITNDITAPSEGAFEIGDDATWAGLSSTFAMGNEFKVFVNDRLRLTGRIEAEDIPVDSQSGSITRVTLRTKLADAMFATADPSTRVKNASLQEFIGSLYAELGYSFENGDFILNADIARNLLTGESTGGQGAVTDIESIKVKEAMVTQSETIYDAADRHLRRFGLMHWDSPDGKIVIGYPNNDQDPIYALRSSRLNFANVNNVLSFNRTQDYSSIPSQLLMFGTGGRPGRPKTRIVAFELDEDVAAAGFYRPVTIVADGLKTQAIADRAAARDMSSRQKQKDNLDVTIDGLTFWDGYRSIPWGVDTVCSMESDVAGGPLGAYYIHRVTLNRDAGTGDTTTITALKRGIWKL